MGAAPAPLLRLAFASAGRLACRTRPGSAGALLPRAPPWSTARLAAGPPATVGALRAVFTAPRLCSPMMQFEPTPERARLLEVVSHLRNHREAREYLRYFSKLDTPRFAVILLESDLPASSQQTLASHLSVLQRFGLFPVVVHGDLTSSMPPDPNDPASTSPSLAARLRHQSMRLVEAIESVGGRACPLVSGVFFAPSKHSSVGKMYANVDMVRAAVAVEQLPVITSVALTAESRLTPADPLEAVELLAQHMQPFKVIFIRAGGGLARRDGAVISVINAGDVVDMRDLERNLTPESWERLAFVRRLLPQLPRTSSATLIPPTELLSELFTHAGAQDGTLVRRGVQLHRYTSLDPPLDENRLRQLLDDAFGKQLVDHYFDDIRRKEKYWIYLAGDYLGGAAGVSVITLERGVPYLCKFAVASKAQGQGIGELLWAAITRDHTDLFWRSRSDNTVNPWYFQRAHGSLSLDKWVVFWYGMKGHDMMAFYRDYCDNLVPTFYQPIATTDD